MRQSNPAHFTAAGFRSTQNCREAHDMMTPRQILRVVFYPPHLKRTCLVALLVGVWLSVFNLGDQLLAGPWNVQLAIRVAMNLLTPFTVANLGLISRQAGTESDKAG